MTRVFGLQSLNLGISTNKERIPMTLPATDPALSTFSKGQSVRAQEFFGSHPAVVNGEAGWTFRVWAPHAKAVSIMGDFNGWNDSDHPMTLLSDGVWEGFIPGLQQ